MNLSDILYVYQLLGILICEMLFEFLSIFLWVGILSFWFPGDFSIVLWVLCQIYIANTFFQDRKTFSFSRLSSALSLLKKSLPTSRSWGYSLMFSSKALLFHLHIRSTRQLEVVFMFCVIKIWFGLFRVDI